MVRAGGSGRRGLPQGPAFLFLLVVSAFDHSAALAQLERIVAYAGPSYSAGGVSFAAVAQDVRAADRVYGDGCERNLTVARSSFTVLPDVGSTITGPDGSLWRLMAIAPGPTAGLRILKLYAEVA